MGNTSYPKVLFESLPKQILPSGFQKAEQHHFLGLLRFAFSTNLVYNL
jgi:hypothetical protein